MSNIKICLEKNLWREKLRKTFSIFLESCLVDDLVDILELSMFINACLLYILFEGVDKGLADEKKK